MDVAAYPPALVLGEWGGQGGDYDEITIQQEEEREERELLERIETEEAQMGR